MLDIKSNFKSKYKGNTSYVKMQKMVEEYQQYSGGIPSVQWSVDVQYSGVEGYHEYSGGMP